MGFGPSRQMRDGTNYGERPVMFKLADAERIAQTVAAVEGARRGRVGSELPRAFASSGHYLAKTTAAWSKGSSQTVAIHTGTAGSETNSGQTVLAWNLVATLPSGIWVLIARANATFYLTSFDYTGLPAYDATKQQVLTHAANGGLAWVNTTACT